MRRTKRACIANDLLFVLCLRVADRHRGISVDQEHSQRETHEVAREWNGEESHTFCQEGQRSVLQWECGSSPTERCSPRGSHSRGTKYLRSARNERRCSSLHSNLANVARIQTIHILVASDSVENGGGVNVVRNGQLDKNSMDVLSLVQFIDQL